MGEYNVAKCSVCGEEVSRVIDGKCMYCLTQDSRHEEKGRMDFENDMGGLTQSDGTQQTFEGLFKNTRIPLPDLSDEAYVAQHSGCDVTSKAWKADGKKLMADIRRMGDQVKAGIVDYGTAERFLSVSKPGHERRLIKRMGGLCIWEYVPEER